MANPLTQVEEIEALSSIEFRKLLQDAPTEERKSELVDLRCATDVELFTKLYFPDFCEYPFNQFHRDKFKTWRLGERAMRIVDGAPRGYAKSTLVALVKPIHDICYHLENFIVILSNTKPQASGKLKDIRNELLTNQLLIDAYGIKFATKKPGETQFIVSCGNHKTMLAAYSAGTEIRGIRYGRHRPTKIICDDVEHSEEVFNEEIRGKYERWFFEVVSQVGNKKTNIEFVGTVLHPSALLINLTKNPKYKQKIYKSVINWSDNQELWQQWKSIYLVIENPNRKEEAQAFFEANKAAMLEGTKVLWPESESYYDLMEELLEKGKRAFMKEKQNSPLPVEDAIFDQMHWYNEVEGGIKVESTGSFLSWESLQHEAYGVLDPATGQTKAKKGRLGDFSCLLTGFKDEHGRVLVHKDWTKRAAPTKYIAEIFEHHNRFNYQKFGVETNLYRNLLLPNILKERHRREAELGKTIKIGFYDIENTDNKEKRIYTLEPKVTHGFILFNRALSGEFMSQLEQFPHGDHDDCPDALEMLWGICNKRYKPAAMPVDAMGGRI
jgi:predicted phage terminase large subunit-like protein